jgi:hypothetical protein
MLCSRELLASCTHCRTLTQEHKREKMTQKNNKLKKVIKKGVRNRKHIYSLLRQSRNSVVGIATDNGMDDRRFAIRVPVGSRIFSTSSRPALGPTQPPIQ